MRAYAVPRTYLRAQTPLTASRKVHNKDNLFKSVVWKFNKVEVQRWSFSAGIKPNPSREAIELNLDDNQINVIAIYFIWLTSDYTTFSVFHLFY